MTKRIPLGRKQENAATDIRLALKQRGYSVMALGAGKDRPFKGWPTEPDDEAAIRRMGGRATAIRMAGCGGLVVIDIDITDEKLVDTVLWDLFATWPQLEQALQRHSGAAKLALFCRCGATGQKRLRSKAWEGGHRAEIFTVNDRRYVGVHGVHSEGREYGWFGPALWEVEFASLPEVLDADLGPIIDCVDRSLESAGLKVVVRAVRPPGEAAGYTDAQLDELLVGSQVPGSWHNCLLSVTGALVMRGWGDAAILEKCAEFAWDGADDEDVLELIEGARASWGRPDPDVVVSGLAPLLQALVSSQGGGGSPSIFGQARDEGVQIKDFVAHMPTHTYIYKPLGNHWPIQSINAVLPKVAVPGVNGALVPLTASTWLDQNRAVQQTLWAPGLPQVVEGKLLADGGWIERPKTAAFNAYRPPVVAEGNGSRVELWLDLLRRIYPGDEGHIVAYFAHRIQRPWEKINHGLVLVGMPGIGKDTIIEPLRWGVGPWNFKEVSPHDVESKWNDFMQAVVVRVSEALDRGDIDRYKLYEKMKTMLAAPPETLRIEGKYVRQFYVLNVAGVIITTNHRHDGLYLPANDRRHYVCGTDATAADFTEGYWNKIWDWYRDGGIDDVVAYLAGYDLVAAGFDPKATPEKTEAFWQLVGHAVTAEESDLNDLLNDKMGKPEVVTLLQLQQHDGAGIELKKWLSDRGNRRTISHRMEACGYVPVRNPERNDGLWSIGERRQAVYGRREIAPQARVTAVGTMIADDKVEAQATQERLRKLKEQEEAKKGRKKRRK